MARAPSVAFATITGGSSPEFIGISRRLFSTPRSAIGELKMNQFRGF
jgi:hypothetical protein